MGANTIADRSAMMYDFLLRNGLVSKKKDVADKMRYNYPNVTSAFKGDTKYLTDSFVNSLNESFGTSFRYEWLLTGEGEMMNEASPDPDRAKEIVQNMGSVTIAPAASHVPYDLFKEMMEDRKRQDETIKELIRQNGMLLDLLYGKRRGQDGSDGNKP